MYGRNQYYYSKTIKITDMKKMLLTCAAGALALPLAADTILWDFETEEQYNQFQLCTWYPSAAGTGHGSTEWFAFDDLSGGLAYTVVMDETDPLIGGTGFRWAVIATLTPSDPQYAPLLEAYNAGKSLSWDVYTTAAGSADWKQSFLAIRGNPGGKQLQWNDLTNAAWPTEGSQTETGTVVLNQPNQRGEEGDVDMPAAPENIQVAFAVNGPINPGSTLVFDNIRIVDAVETPTWAGFDILTTGEGAGWADTGADVLGWVWPYDEGDYVWSARVGGYLYVDADNRTAIEGGNGFWTYVFRPAAE